MKSLTFEEHLSVLEELSLGNQAKLTSAVARLRSVFNAISKSSRPLCANPECLNPSVGRSKYCSDEIRAGGGCGCAALVRAKRYRDKY
jgi:hypothetical protein